MFQVLSVGECGSASGALCGSCHNALIGGACQSEQCSLAAYTTTVLVGVAGNGSVPAPVVLGPLDFVGYFPWEKPASQECEKRP